MLPSLVPVIMMSSMMQSTLPNPSSTLSMVSWHLVGALAIPNGNQKGNQKVFCSQNSKLFCNLNYCVLTTQVMAVLISHSYIYLTKDCDWFVGVCFQK